MAECNNQDDEQQCRRRSWMHCLPVLLIIWVSLGMLSNFEEIISLGRMQATASYLFRDARQGVKPRVVMFVWDSNDDLFFESRMGRGVETMWYGSNDPSHIDHEEKIGMLRNPVTHEGKQGRDGCTPALQWQKRFYPTCNTIHEVSFLNHDDSYSLDFLAAGTSRDAWKVVSTNNNDTTVLKTLQMDREYSGLTYHFQLLDAIASEKLSSSPYVMHIYGFCGMSVLNEMGVEFQVSSNYNQISALSRLEFAGDLAAAVAAAHAIDGTQYPRLVHADIRNSNVMLSSQTGALTLGDFNQGYFLGWDMRNNQTCGYRPQFSFWDDRFASPEECLQSVQTEKTDIYHLGGMMYYILTGSKPYIRNKDDFERRTTMKKISSEEEWILPLIPEKYSERDEPAVVAMLEAIRACLRFDAKERPSAQEIVSMLNHALLSMRQGP